MHRLIEILLGLRRGFLARSGELSLSFHPHWPGQSAVGAWPWNLLLLILAGVLIWWVYRRESGSRRIRIILAALRSLALLLVLLLLNRPVISLVQARVEPSVLPILVDTSMSMKVPDVSENGQEEARLAAVQQLLSANTPLVKALEKEHQLRFYSFDQSATSVPNQKSLDALNPTGSSTNVTGSIRSVLDDLRGQRVAGMVVLTDGRQIPPEAAGGDLAAIRDMGVHIYPVPVGTDAPAKNVRIENLAMQDTAFLGDIIDPRATVRASGFGPSARVKLMLKNARTGQTLTLADGSTSVTAQLADNQPQVIELPYKPDAIGPLDLQVVVLPLPGEIDDTDNARTGQVSVLKAKITVLYVDGYPRWDYRYVKNEMIRDKTVNISCLLTSADPGFIQEGDIPITRFPETMNELMDYDVVLFGDVDPHQFSDAQLQLVNDFVAKDGGGFGMVAGPRWSPSAYRNTPIEPILPVLIRNVEPDDSTTDLTQTFRPIVTPAGLASGIFRFLPNIHANAEYLKNDWPGLFWFCRGVIAKPGVGQVYAEHPTITGPDGKRAPIMVFGRYGAGRTMFLGIDDSWRWRFYTGENVFDTFWVQTLRQLARGRRLGQRRFSFTSSQPIYDVGSRVELNLRLLDPRLPGETPDQVQVDVLDANGQLVGHQNLIRQSSQRDLYTADWSADHVGHFMIRLPAIAPGLDQASFPLDVRTPRLELADPAVDSSALNRLAAETSGQVVPLNDIDQLPRLIPSVAKTAPVTTEQLLWSSPLVMLLIVGCLVAEWIVRKTYGLV